MIENGELLRKQLVATFDTEELRTLCFSLQVDYDSLTGDGKAAKVRELVAYYDRRDEMDKLIVAAHRLRPNQERWIDLASQCKQGHATNRIVMVKIGTLEVQMDQVFSMMYKFVTMSVINFALLMFLSVCILVILMKIL